MSGGRLGRSCCITAASGLVHMGKGSISAHVCITMNVVGEISESSDWEGFKVKCYSQKREVCHVQDVST